MSTIFIPLSEMQTEFKRILSSHGLNAAKAESCARIFAENSLDGVYSHGINRFPRFIEYLKKGYINGQAEPEKIHSSGALEQWDGRLGPGPLNAVFSTSRAIQIASEYGLGCVALSNTNHWMRGGTYGWQAAKKGFAFIGWTNTEANMPAWGSRESRLGNNPLVFALPFNNEAIVLDFAMTQYSYGKMEAAYLETKELPYPGGYNKEGKLTTIPEEILQSRRALPVGFWKGAGLSLMLDVLATVLSAGLPTHKISKKKAEYGLSQVFIAFDLKNLSNFPAFGNVVNQIISDFKNSVPDESGGSIRYPGERVLLIRKENLTNGIPVNEKIWSTILNL